MINSACQFWDGLQQPSRQSRLRQAGRAAIQPALVISTCLTFFRYRGSHAEKKLSTKAHVNCMKRRRPDHAAAENEAPINDPSLSHGG